MFRTFCILLTLLTSAYSWSLTPEQLEFNEINTITDPDIAAERFEILAEHSMVHSDLLLEIALRSTANRVYLLNSQYKYAEAGEIAKDAISRFDQYNDPHIRAKVVSLLLNQSSAMKKLGKTEEHLQLLKRVTDDYIFDENVTTQTLVAQALLSQVDAHLLAKENMQAQSTFALFDKRYMQSRVYQRFESEGVSTLCDVVDPCQPYAAGKHWLTPNFFADRAAWYRKQLNRKSS